MIDMLADEINELAEYCESMEPLPNFKPSNARWWLAGLCREQPRLMKSSSLTQLLTPISKKWVALLLQ